MHNWFPSGNEKCKTKIWQTPSLVRGSVKLVRAWRPDLLDMLGFWYNDLTHAQDSPKVTLVEPLDAEIYYVYSLADFSYYCGYSLVAAGLGIDRNLVLDYGRTSAWRLNFKNQTYPSNPGVNPDLIRPKTKKFPLDPQFKPTVHWTHVLSAPGSWCCRSASP